MFFEVLGTPGLGEAGVLMIFPVGIAIFVIAITALPLAILSSKSNTLGRVCGFIGVLIISAVMFYLALTFRLPLFYSG
jgi:hypothetical protein